MRICTIFSVISRSSPVPGRFWSICMMFEGLGSVSWLPIAVLVLSNENRTQDAGRALLRQGGNPKVRRNSGLIHWGRGLRTFSWRWPRSHSPALTVLHRTHPTKRPFDALVVVPADAVVDQGEHLVTDTLLPTPGMDGLRLHAPEEPLRGSVVRGNSPSRPSTVSGRSGP